jgi:hypothetical protein
MRSSRIWASCTEMSPTTNTTRLGPNSRMRTLAFLREKVPQDWVHSRDLVTDKILYAMEQGIFRSSPTARPAMAASIPEFGERHGGGFMQRRRQTPSRRSNPAEAGRRWWGEDGAFAIRTCRSVNPGCAPDMLPAPVQTPRDGTRSAFPQRKPTPRPLRQERRAPRWQYLMKLAASLNARRR